MFPQIVLQQNFGETGNFVNTQLTNTIAVISLFFASLNYKTFEMKCYLKGNKLRLCLKIWLSHNNSKRQRLRSFPHKPSAFSIYSDMSPNQVLEALSIGKLSYLICSRKKNGQLTCSNTFKRYCSSGYCRDSIPFFFLFLRYGRHDLITKS